MARTADYTIQGFIYQFLVTLNNILGSSDDAEILVEGIIEDIEVTTPSGTEVIQCKYHETKANYTLSSIYKPVLQMMCHFKRNSSSDIKYRLHAHFPNEPINTTKKLTIEELKEILNTKTAGLQKYLTELVGFTDYTGFLSKLELHFGASYSDTESSAILALCKEGLTTEDVKEIFYPNAIHKIAELSIKHDVTYRKVKKNDFLNDLKGKKKSAISRWTKELQSFELILKKRRKQLRENLNKNLRTRFIVLDGEYIINFESEVTLFIKDFIDKYNSKIKLNHPPTVSLICTEDQLNSIWQKLRDKNIDVERGIIAGKLDVGHFLRMPMKNIKESKAEFLIRICNHNTEFSDVMNKAKVDDLILLTNKDIESHFKLDGINVEKIETSDIKEIRYLLSLNDTL